MPLLLRCAVQTELLAMEDLRHPNILRMYGYVSKTTPSLIYEFIPNGNVSVFLRKGEREWSSL